MKLDAPGTVRGRRVLVVEDGPTITHGGMSHGAGLLAAQQTRAAELLDPRGWGRGAVAALYARDPHIGPVLPAVGYGPRQLEALADAINASPAEAVVLATPCDLAALIGIDKPVTRARYEFADLDQPGLGDLADGFLRQKPAGGA